MVISPINVKLEIFEGGVVMGAFMNILTVRGRTTLLCLLKFKCVCITDCGQGEANDACHFYVKVFNCHCLHPMFLFPAMAPGRLWRAEPALPTLIKQSGK